MLRIALVLVLVLGGNAVAQSSERVRTRDSVDVTLVRGERRVRALEDDSGQWRTYRDRRGRPVRLRFFTDENHLPPSNFGPGGMGGSGYSFGEPAGMGSVVPRQQP